MGDDIYKSYIQWGVDIENSITKKIAIWFNNHTSGYISKRLKAESWKDIQIPMFTGALVTAVKRWKQLKCSLMNK